MSVAAEEPDPFEVYCRDNNFTTETERAEAFATYMADTTGWDGNTFSLTEDELFWIARAYEITEWIKLYQTTGLGESLGAALRCVNSLRPIPESLKSQLDI